MPTPTQTEAQRRVDEALRLLQRAQELTGQAQSLLSSIIGGYHQSERTGKLYDRIRTTWYFVAKIRGSERIDLDGLSGPAFLKRQSQTDAKP